MSADAPQEKDLSNPPPIPDAQREAERLLTKWREREVALCRRADGQSSTQYAMRIGAAAEEIANMMIDFEPVVTALAADCERLQQENERIERVAKMCGESADRANIQMIEAKRQLTASQQEVTRLTAALTTLRDKWIANADMLAEGNKSEGYDEGAGMQRACAYELDDTLTHLLTGETR